VAGYDEVIQSDVGVSWQSFHLAIDLELLEHKIDLITAFIS